MSRCGATSRGAGQETDDGGDGPRGIHQQPSINPGTHQQPSIQSGNKSATIDKGHLRTNMYFYRLSTDPLPRSSTTINVPKNSAILDYTSLSTMSVFCTLPILYSNYHSKKQPGATSNTNQCSYTKVSSVIKS